MVVALIPEPTLAVRCFTETNQRVPIKQRVAIQRQIRRQIGAHEGKRCSLRIGFFADVNDIRIGRLPSIYALRNDLREPALRLDKSGMNCIGLGKSDANGKAQRFKIDVAIQLHILCNDEGVSRR